MSSAPAVLSFDLFGTLAFALNGNLTAARVVRSDIVGVLALLAAAVCFAIRVAGVRFNWNAPKARTHREEQR